MSINVKYSIRIGERLLIIINEESYFLENENGFIKLKKQDHPSGVIEIHHPPVGPPKMPSRFNEYSIGPPDPNKISRPPNLPPLPKLPSKYSHAERDDKIK